MLSGGRWLVFDVFHGNYFLNASGEIASIEDLMANPRLVLQAKGPPSVRGVTYLNIFEGLEPPGPVDMVRGEHQMPGRRLVREIRRLLAD